MTARSGTAAGGRAAVFALLCVALLGPPAARAGDFRVEAAVDRNVVAVGGTLRLTITVSGASDFTRPDLGDLEGFEVIGTSTSQSISMVNLKVTRSLSVTYTLAATREGEFTLGPFTVQAGGDVGETRPISVKVVPASGAVQRRSRRPSADEAAGGDAAFATASVDKRRVYVGEQVTYTLRFAYRLRMLQDMQFIPPEHTGFWYEDLGDEGPVIEVINGMQYYVVTKKLAFFPISSGTHEIGESGIRYVAEAGDSFWREPFSFFGHDPFSRLHGREGVAMADPVRIEVLPLPEVGRPPDFSGAVGRFGVSARATRNEVKVGESVTLVVKITGSGNLKSMGDLAIPDLPGFRVFSPKSKQTMRTEGGVVGGEKRFEFVLVAEEPGTFTIDGIGFTYFDTAREEYATATAAPLKITVLPGDVAAASGKRAPGIDLGGTDIRHIHRPGRLCNDLTLAGASQAVVLLAMPVAVGLAGVIVEAARKRRAARAKVSARKAYKDATAEIKRARAAAGKSGGREDAAAILSRGIARYIADRAGRPERPVDVETVASLAAIPEELRSRLAGLLNALDQVRFAPAGAGGEDLEEIINEAERLLERVNREWKE